MVKNHSDSGRGNPLPPHGYSFRLTARVLLYAPSHRQDSTYHSLCYTSHGALAGTRNSSMGPPWRIDSMNHCTMSERSYHGATSRSLTQKEYMRWFDLWSYLILVNLPNREVHRFGMSEVDSWHWGCGFHGQRFRQGDSHRVCIQQPPHRFLLGVIGLAGIARGWTDSLK